MEIFWAIIYGVLIVGMVAGGIGFAAGIYFHVSGKRSMKLLRSTQVRNRGHNMGVYDMKNRELRRERLLRLGWALGTLGHSASYSIFSDEEFERRFPERAKRLRKWKRQIKVYKKLFNEFMKDEPDDRIRVDPGHPEGDRSVTLEIRPEPVVDIAEGEDE